MFKQEIFSKQYIFSLETFSKCANVADIKATFFHQMRLRGPKLNALSFFFSKCVIFQSALLQTTAVILPRQRMHTLEDKGDRLTAL